MNETGPLIAVLDDEPQMCKALNRLLKTHGFEVVSYTQGVDFLSDCELRKPDCLLLDLHMPVMNGFEVLQRLAVQSPAVPVIVFTGQDQPGNCERVRALGAREYLLKPLNETLLVEAIRNSISGDAPEKRLDCSVPQFPNGDKS